MLNNISEGGCPKGRIVEGHNFEIHAKSDYIFSQNHTLILALILKFSNI